MNEQKIMNEFADLLRENTELKQRIRELEELVPKWISINSDDDLPSYGEPVLIKINGVVQNVTYILDGCYHSPDWFEPSHFNHDNSCKIGWNKPTHWMQLPEAKK